jgi:sacsin
VNLENAEAARQHAPHLALFRIDSLPQGGTIFRLPLRRTTQSKISPGSGVHPDVVSKLLEDFVKEELNISLLFLQSIRSIEIHEIDEMGTQTCIGKVFSGPTGSDMPHLLSGDRLHSTFQRRMIMEIDGQRAETTWRVLQSSFSASVVEEQFKTAGARGILARNKLRADTAIAIPCNPVHPPIDGRLFTFLPLPIYPCIPCHVHAMFSLSQSRQNLRNGSEKGMAVDRDDRFAIFIFSCFH